MDAESLTAERAKNKTKHEKQEDKEQLLTIMIQTNSKIVKTNINSSMYSSSPVRIALISNDANAVNIKIDTVILCYGQRTDDVIQHHGIIKCLEHKGFIIVTSKTNTTLKKRHVAESRIITTFLTSLKFLFVSLPLSHGLFLYMLL